MKSRVVKAAGERGKDVTLLTFHAFCEILLKEVDPQFVVLDEVDHWILLRRNMARLKLEKFRRLAEPGQFLADFVKFFSRCQDELVSSDDYQRYADGLAAQLEAERATLEDDVYNERAENVALQKEIAQAYRASEELLDEKKRVSFGALITRAVALLQKDAALRERLQQRYKHILVDEFQDTNIAQLELLHLLTCEPRNIVAVGDNDQAIYRFRGASFGSFKLFLERFAGWKAGEDSSKFRVTLTENYRSTPNILRVATQVIGQNEVSADFPKKVLFAHAAGRRSHPRRRTRRWPKTNRAGSPANWNACTPRARRGAILRCCTARTRTAISWSMNSRAARFRSSSRASRSLSIRWCATSSPICA